MCLAQGRLDRLRRPFPGKDEAQVLVSFRKRDDLLSQGNGDRHILDAGHAA